MQFKFLTQYSIYVYHCMKIIFIYICIEIIHYFVYIKINDFFFIKNFLISALYMHIVK